MSLEETLKNNLESIRARMQQACERAGSKSDEVTLVAVTKTVGPEETDTLVELGATDIGENRVLEALKKFEVMKQTNCRRHFIGHLQRNKARQVVENFDFIHSVDSLRLAKELQKEAARIGKTIPVLIQVNVATEEQKHGFDPGAVGAALEALRGHENLQVQGLMTMAPIVGNAEETRPVFAGLRDLREGLIGDFPDLRHLSMGMTQDFEVAIEEGATMVRVGSALFEGMPE
ncbi:MAG: YggS family pyridoxal phosphate-dependent enzyme [Planctomycetota bacterium]|jgi:hypothetical protein|nr:YggS family pyridoxal phosphate-dependent enzyme [Planctomycetota bacterium]MDP7248434.1 YggS family pyridoxal phosphate-dependent enzyme [Planctomycetota bacterium]